MTLIPGDGVGPEVSEATRRVLEATGVEFEWDVQNAGLGVMEQYGTPMPAPVLESIHVTPTPAYFILKEHSWESSLGSSWDLSQGGSQA